MDATRLASLVSQGEGLSIEFKRCGNRPGQDVFETICSFANRQGGTILLGVRDDGSVEGIGPQAIVSVERNIVNVTCDPSLFNTAPAIEFERITQDGKLVLRVWVPMGPSVYRFKGVVYDRRAVVDVKLKSDVQINAMYLRKQNIYTERRIYPHVRTSDLRFDLVSRMRSMIRSARGGGEHPWLGLDDEGFLRAARLWSRDPESGMEGLDLAAVMLLGSDDMIQDIVPVYRTDAILRRVDGDRYDDRLVVRTNLLESYDSLMGFCEKWLPDSFALDGVTRVSVRDVIARELVVNTLIHREFVSPYLAQLIIDREGIHTRNASRTLYSGRITPENLDPTPKNPIIANVFTQLGVSEELGSGTRNLYRSSLLYTGREPMLEDGDFFTAFVPVPDVMGPRGTGGPAREAARPKGESVRDAVMGFLSHQERVTASEVAQRMGISARSARRGLSKLVRGGLVSTVGAGRSTAYRLATHRPLD